VDLTVPLQPPAVKGTMPPEYHDYSKTVDKFEAALQGVSADEFARRCNIDSFDFIEQVKIVSIDVLIDLFCIKQYEPIDFNKECGTYGIIPLHAHKIHLYLRKLMREKEFDKPPLSTKFPGLALLDTPNTDTNKTDTESQISF
jgi:hypothetical protein